MNAEEYYVTKDFIQEMLRSKHFEDIIFDPLYKDHPKQTFPNIAYELAGRLATRFDFIDWDILDQPDYWVWKLIMDEIQKLENERHDWENEEWLRSPIK